VIKISIEHRINEKFGNSHFLTDIVIFAIFHPFFPLSLYLLPLFYKPLSDIYYISYRYHITLRPIIQNGIIENQKIKRQKTIYTLRRKEDHPTDFKIRPLFLLKKISCTAQNFIFRLAEREGYIIIIFTKRVICFRDSFVLYSVIWSNNSIHQCFWKYRRCWIARIIIFS